MRSPQSPRTPSHLLYLHGFRSSPQSFKARRLSAWLAKHRPQVHWVCPQLPPSPREALAMLGAMVSPWRPGEWAVVGSSLGGFYATVLAQRHPSLRACVINPAVNPARDLAAYIGEIKAWHSDERFWFRPEFVEELTQMTPPALSDMARYFPIIATGDELLSWEEMAARYAGAPTKIVQGSDHGLSDFEDHLPALLGFLGLSP